jgi:hypothetical protein
MLCIIITGRLVSKLKGDFMQRFLRFNGFYDRLSKILIKVDDNDPP